jgi:hypothetical protein
VTHRIAIGEVEPRHRLVDERHMGGTMIFRLVPYLALQHRNPKQRKVTGADEIHPRFPIVARRLAK